MKMLNNYIVRLTIALLIAAALSEAAYTVIINNDRKYFNAIQKTEFLFKQDTTTYDLIMIGASRIKNTVNPRIFDSATGLNTYNAGVSAARIREHKMILDAYLQTHKPPKYILMTLDMITMETDGFVGYHPNYLTVADVPAIRKSLDKEGVHTELYDYLPFLRMVEMNDYYKGIVIRNIRGKKELRDGDYMYKGYVSNTTDTIKEDKTGIEHAATYNKESFDLLQAMADSANKYGTKMIFIYSPEYKGLNYIGMKGYRELFDKYEEFASRNHIPFYRHDKLPMSQERKYFANNGHVNRIGADVYTRQLARILIDDNIITVRKDTIQ